MQLFYHPDLSPELASGGGYSVTLSETESLHATRALRIRNGDAIILTDGNGFFYDGVIEHADSRATLVEVTSVRKDERSYSPSLTLAIAPTKNPDRIEWLAEKITELGVAKIILVRCEHSEKDRLNLDRLNRLLISAMKQSNRSVLPAIQGNLPFAELMKEGLPEQRFIAWCETGEEAHIKHLFKLHCDTVILIGPEGDFSKEEVDLAIENGFKPVSLGSFRLRTETAGLMAAAFFNNANS